MSVALLGAMGAGAPESDVVFLTRNGCAQTATMRANLDAALRTLNRATRYTVVDADVLPEQDALRGYGTPTVLVNGSDLFDMPAPGPGPHTPT